METDRFLELLSWRDPEFFPGCGMLVDWIWGLLSLFALHPDTYHKLLWFPSLCLLTTSGHHRCQRRCLSTPCEAYLGCQGSGQGRVGVKAWTQESWSGLHRHGHPDCSTFLSSGSPPLTPSRSREAEETHCPCAAVLPHNAAAQGTLVWDMENIGIPTWFVRKTITSCVELVSLSALTCFNMSLLWAWPVYYLGLSDCHVVIDSTGRVDWGHTFLISSDQYSTTLWLMAPLVLLVLSVSIDLTGFFRAGLVSFIYFAPKHQFMLSAPFLHTCVGSLTVCLCVYLNIEPSLLETSL